MKLVPGPFGLWQFMIGTSVAAGLCLSFRGWQWDALESKIHRTFPSVPQLATSDLAGWLINPKATQPLILDVRTLAEFEVSHLAGARRVDPDAQPSSLELPAQKTVPIVTYCAVGYRSSALAQRLQAAGYTRVFNLDGALFKWANEDRALVNERGSATQVHPYGATWQYLLKPERRAPLP